MLLAWLPSEVTSAPKGTYAVEAHSGQAYGARDDSQLLAVWHAACRQSGMVALAFALIYGLAGEQIIALLTSLPSLQQLADRVKRIF